MPGKFTDKIQALALKRLPPSTPAAQTRAALTSTPHEPPGDSVKVQMSTQRAWGSADALVPGPRPHPGPLPLAAADACAREGKPHHLPRCRGSRRGSCSAFQTCHRPGLRWASRAQGLVGNVPSKPWHSSAENLTGSVVSRRHRPESPGESASGAPSAGRTTKTEPVLCSGHADQGLRGKRHGRKRPALTEPSEQTSDEAVFSLHTCWLPESSPNPAIVSVS